MEKQTEIYTLQRFYHEAKALIESCPDLAQKSQLEDIILDVEFSIQETKTKAPQLKCSIFLRGHIGSDKSYVFIYDKPTPQDAIITLKELTKKLNGNMIEDRVGIEVKPK